MISFPNEWHYNFLFQFTLIYDILRQVSGRTIEGNSSPIDFQSGGEAIETNFSPL